MKILKIIGVLLALIGMWTVWVLWQRRSVQTLVIKEIPLEKAIDLKEGEKNAL
jgi:hypothetical protein